mgnify:CR=1 FL=1
MPIAFLTEPGSVAAPTFLMSNTFQASAGTRVPRMPLLCTIHTSAVYTLTAINYTETSVEATMDLACSNRQIAKYYIHQEVATGP